MVRKGSTVRVRQRASSVCRGFLSGVLGPPRAEVPNGYVLGAPDGAAGRGQRSRSRLLLGVRSRTEAAFLRPSEAAEITGLSTRAIYRAIERGELPAARLCSRLRIPRAAFDEWVERCAVRAPEPPSPMYPRVPPPAAGSFRSLLARREEGSS